MTAYNHLTTNEVGFEWMGMDFHSVFDIKCQIMRISRDSTGLLWTPASHLLISGS